MAASCRNQLGLGDARYWVPEILPFTDGRAASGMLPEDVLFVPWEALAALSNLWTWACQTIQQQSCRGFVARLRRTSASPPSR